MKKIDAKKPLKTLDGKIVMIGDSNKEEFTVGKAISNILLTNKDEKIQAFKAYSLAKRFFEATGEIELDESDFNNIIELLEKDTTYTNLVLGQVIEYMNNCK